MPNQNYRKECINCSSIQLSVEALWGKIGDYVVYNNNLVKIESLIWTFWGLLNVNFFDDLEISLEPTHWANLSLRDTIWWAWPYNLQVPHLLLTTSVNFFWPIILHFMEMKIEF